MAHNMAEVRFFRFAFVSFFFASIALALRLVVGSSLATTVDGDRDDGVVWLHVPTQCTDCASGEQWSHHFRRVSEVMSVQSSYSKSKSSSTYSSNSDTRHYFCRPSQHCPEGRLADDSDGLQFDSPWFSFSYCVFSVIEEPHRVMNFSSLPNYIANVNPRSSCLKHLASIVSASSTIVTKDTNNHTNTNANANANWIVAMIDTVTVVRPSLDRHYFLRDLFGSSDLESTLPRCFGSLPVSLLSQSLLCHDENINSTSKSTDNHQSDDRNEFPALDMIDLIDSFSSSLSTFSSTKRRFPPAAAAHHVNFKCKPSDVLLMDQTRSPSLSVPDGEVFMFNQAAVMAVATSISIDSDQRKHQSQISQRCGTADAFLCALAFTEGLVYHHEPRFSVLHQSHPSYCDLGSDLLCVEHFITMSPLNNVSEALRILNSCPTHHRSPSSIASTLDSPSSSSLWVISASFMRQLTNAGLHASSLIVGDLALESFFHSRNSPHALEFSTSDDFLESEVQFDLLAQYATSTCAAREFELCSVALNRLLRHSMWQRPPPASSSSSSSQLSTLIANCNQVRNRNRNPSPSSSQQKRILRQIRLHRSSFHHLRHQRIVDDSELVVKYSLVAGAGAGAGVGAGFSLEKSTSRNLEGSLRQLLFQLLIFDSSSAHVTSSSNNTIRMVDVLVPFEAVLHLRRLIIRASLAVSHFVDPFGWQSELLLATVHSLENVHKGLQTFAERQTSLSEFQLLHRFDHSNPHPKANPDPPPTPKKQLSAFAFILQLCCDDGVRAGLRLLRRIYHPSNVYVLHLDAKRPPEEHVELLHRVSTSRRYSFHANVHVLPPHYVTYFGPTITVNEIACLRLALEAHSEWRYAVILSPTHYPLAPVEAMMELFAHVPSGLNFVGEISDTRPVSYRLHFLHYDSALEGKPSEVGQGLWGIYSWKKYRPSKVDTEFWARKGSQWVTLARSFVEYVTGASLSRSSWSSLSSWPSFPLQHLQQQLTDRFPTRLLMYFTNTEGSDELYFQTLLRASPFAHTTVLNITTHLRWNTRDQETGEINWGSYCLPSGAKPCSFTLEDARELSESGALFGRKIQDPQLKNWLDRRMIGWRSESGQERVEKSTNDTGGSDSFDAAHVMKNLQRGMWKMLTTTVGDQRMRDSWVFRMHLQRFKRWMDEWSG